MENEANNNGNLQKLLLGLSQQQLEQWIKTMNYTLIYEDSGELRASVNIDEKEAWINLAYHQTKNDICARLREHILTIETLERARHLELMDDDRRTITVELMEDPPENE